MKKVLLIAFYFDQVNEIASKRLRALANYLSDFGWEPIVLVPDLGLKPSENKNLNCKIVYTDYEDMFSKYLSKIKLSSKSKKDNDSRNILEDSYSESSFALSSNSSSKLSFDKGSDSSSKSSSESSLNENKLKDSSSVDNKLISKAISIAGEVFAYPDGMKYWYGPAMDSASKIIEEENIQAIISSSWPITAHTIAKDLKSKYNIPWIADLRDLWNLNPYVSHTFIRIYFEKKLEIATFKNADILTTTTELAALTLATLHPENKIISIPSGFDIADFKEFYKYENNYKLNSDLEDNYKLNGNLNENYKLNSDLEDNYKLNGDLEDKLKFIYAGSLYSGKRDPSLLFEAIYQLANENKIDLSRIAIDFYGDSGNVSEIANSYGVGNIVNVNGKISHDEVLKREFESNVLLLISWDNEKEKMFIPGKVYEYMALKRPVLSIGYKEGSLKDLINKTAIGYHVSDLDSTKNVLMNYYNEFIENGSVKYSANKYVNEFSMKNMAKKFAESLNCM